METGKANHVLPQRRGQLPRQRKDTENAVSGFRKSTVANSYSKSSRYNRLMIKRKTNGQFAKGSKPVAGFKKGNAGPKHPRWKGGKPKCSVCQKQLSRMDAKNCREHTEFSEERKERIRQGAKKRSGKLAYQWQGEKVSYRALHFWIQRNLGKATKCSACGKEGTGRQIHWSNISRKYKRVFSDWQQLCAKCHKEYDKKNVSK